MSKIVKFSEFLAANDADNPILLEQTSEIFMPSFADYYEYRINEQGTGLWGGLKAIGRKIKNWWTGKSDEPAPAKPTPEDINSQEVQNAQGNLQNLQKQYEELMKPEKVTQELSNLLISMVPQNLQNQVKGTLLPNTQMGVIKQLYDGVKAQLTNTRNPNPYAAFKQFVNNQLTKPHLVDFLTNKLQVPAANITPAVQKYFGAMDAKMQQLTNAMQQAQQVMSQTQQSGTNMKLANELKAVSDLDVAGQVGVIKNHMDIVTNTIQDVETALSTLGLNTNSIFNDQNKVATQYIALKTSMEKDKAQAAKKYLNAYIMNMFSADPKQLPPGVDLVQFGKDNKSLFDPARVKVTDALKAQKILNPQILDKVRFDVTNTNDKNGFGLLITDPKLKDLAEAYKAQYDVIASLVNRAVVLGHYNDTPRYEQVKGALYKIGQKLATAKPTPTPAPFTP